MGPSAGTRDDPPSLKLRRAGDGGGGFGGWRKTPSEDGAKRFGWPYWADGNYVDPSLMLWARNGGFWVICFWLILCGVFCIIMGCVGLFSIYVGFLTVNGVCDEKVGNYHFGSFVCF